MTPEEVGALFERDIGHRYEHRGWMVWYRGIERGKGDLGIDLVATKGNRQMLIQCKCWTARETIPHVEIERFAEACRKYVGRREKEGIDLLPGIAPLRTYGMAYITTAHFSAPAVQAAQARGVALRAAMPMPEDPIAYDPDGPRFACSEPIIPMPEVTPHAFHPSASASPERR